MLACALASGCGSDRDPLDHVTTAQASATSGYQPPEPTTDEAPTTGMVDELCSGGAIEESGGVAPDGGWGVRECDQWIQDCPDGFKCMPFSGDGDNAWESLKCTPVVPNAAGPGEACTAFGGHVSGYDSCAKGSMCWNVDPETCLGRCVEQCKGLPDQPICTQPSTLCLTGAEAVLTLCLPVCDPLEQTCPEGEVCIPNLMNPSSFICLKDASGEAGQVFDVCEYLNACDPGLLCANPELAEECEQSVGGCCLPFCDLAAPDCPGVGQECLAWYEEGMAPPGNEDIGVCGVPQ